MGEWDREELLGAVDRLARAVLAAAGVTAPPVDAGAVAAHLGLELDEDGRPRGGRRPRTGHATPEQRQWLAAQAAGDHLKGRLLEQLGVAGDGRRGLDGASLANLLAVRLLVPTAWFAADARAAGFDLPTLKERYATASHETLALRLLDLPEPCAVTVYDGCVVTKRQSNAYRVTRKPEPVEAECQARVHRTSRPCRLRRDGWTVDGWPVHGIDVKREILRSVYDD